MTTETVAAPPPPPAPPTPALHLTNLQLFLAFSQMSLMGFGGVLPQAYHQIVERRKWLSPAEFGELLVFCQIMPGPTIITLSIIYGNRHGGTRGALASMAGLVVLPFLIVCGLGLIYQQFGEIESVKRALKGMTVVAAGLVCATGAKIMLGLPRNWLPWLIASLVFLAVGLLREPLLGVLAVLGPLGVYLQWRRERGRA